MTEEHTEMPRVPIIAKKKKKSFFVHSQHAQVLFLNSFSESKSLDHHFNSTISAFTKILIGCLWVRSDLSHHRKCQFIINHHRRLMSTKREECLMIQAKPNPLTKTLLASDHFFKKP
jgi:hypothetical protein